MERALGEKRCPVCDNKIYPAGAIIIQDVAFCRTCVKCVECVRVFDGKDMALGPPNDPSPKPYCKFCFAKAFGISALNITEMVAIGNVRLFVNFIFILYARWRFKNVCIQTKLASLAMRKKTLISIDFQLQFSANVARFARKNLISVDFEV